MVSGTGTFVDVCWWAGPPWIGHVLAGPKDVRSDWDLGNLEAPHVFPFLSSFCGKSGRTVGLGGPLPSRRTVALRV